MNNVNKKFDLGPAPQARRHVFIKNPPNKKARSCLFSSDIFSGPEVRGCRPVLVSFETFKDRETVLRQSKALKRAAIDVTEDLSKRTRESRQELRKFMRKVRAFFLW